jgi:predicted transcriptional regulator of viral defense system
VLIESEQDQDGAYRWIRLRAEEDEPDKRAAFAQRVLDALEAGQMRNVELAEQLGVKPNDNRLRSALATLTQRGAIVKLERGLYQLAP